jgi:stearoyl-CoA desaturase (delta-9 desaturase)
MLWNMFFYASLTLGTAFVLMEAATIATTVYLHRSVTHRSITFHPVVAWLFRWTIWETLGIIDDEYEAVHLEHHEHTDVPGDPHSPHIPDMGGVVGVTLKNVLLYRKAKNDPELRAKWKVGTHDDVWDKYLFNTGILGPISGTLELSVAYGLWLGWPGVVCALCACTLHGAGYIFLSGCINGLCHWSGERNFGNTATNRRWLALVTGGEGWHNNHHGYPTSPKLGFKKEFDPGWQVVAALVRLNLATRLPTIEERIAARA